MGANALKSFGDAALTDDRIPAALDEALKNLAA